MKKYILFAACLLAACDESSKSTHVSAAEVVENYASNAYRNYLDAENAAHALRSAVQQLSDNPTPAKLEFAKRAWLEAREVYLLTEAFRFYGGPIDDENNREGRINAWPLDEAYIDYVRSDTNPQERINTGIIYQTMKNPDVNIPSYDITKENLKALNENGGETNIAVGFHAIEFLLWGQDFENYGPGSRPYTDFVNDDTQVPQRRKAYLQAVCDLLIDDLQEITEAWEENSTNYRSTFVANPEDALTKILRGLGALSKAEMGGDRINTALTTQLQEDEHSCFSDNTHRDMIVDALGIYNAYMGQYADFSGPSIHQLLVQTDEELALKLKNELQDTITKMKQIPVPFDIAITNTEGRSALNSAMLAAQKQGDDIVKAARALGLGNINIEIK